MDKSKRNIFVDGSIDEIQSKFQVSAFFDFYSDQVINMPNVHQSTILDFDSCECLHRDSS